MESCPFGTMGVTKPKAPLSLTIPCDYQECPDGYEKQEQVSTDEVRCVQNGVVSPNENTTVAVSPNVSFLLLPKSLSPEEILLSSHTLEVRRMYRTVIPSWTIPFLPYRIRYMPDRPDRAIECLVYFISITGIGVFSVLFSIITIKNIK